MVFFCFYTGNTVHTLHLFPIPSPNPIEGVARVAEVTVGSSKGGRSGAVGKTTREVTAFFDAGVVFLDIVSKVAFLLMVECEQTIRKDIMQIHTRFKGFGAK